MPHALDPALLASLPDVASAMGDGGPALLGSPALGGPVLGGHALDDAPPADHALADMAEILAHRMRSLLGSIQGYTDLLTDTLATYEQREMAMRIFEGVAGLEGILAGLRRFADEPVAVCRPMCPRALAEEMPVVVGERGPRVVVTAQDVGSLKADRVLLRQALLLLLQNALDATRGPVGLHLSRQPDGVTFHVSNDGDIEAAVAERMFRPFYTTKAQHLGLGLPLAQRLAEAHGGRLTWEPWEGETTFALFVPSGA